MDGTNPIVLQALKQVARSSDPLRLYRSGKLTGLFATRSGSAAEAAAWCLEQGLLEVVKTEARGKLVTEWVRATPKGIELLHRSESPMEALIELRSLLTVTSEGLPRWVGEVRARVVELADQIDQAARAWTSEIRAIREQVDSALVRLNLAESQLPAELSNGFPWVAAAIRYLIQRAKTGAPDPCPLAELFAAIALHHQELSLAQFHQGIRGLRDAGWVTPDRLSSDVDSITDPEFAFVDGEVVYDSARLRPR